MVFIKTITIQGFKSYRDQTQVEPFSPAHNVVVGRNGSGKSNFFAAIRFVLGDAYTSMGKEERQSLLHEGVSATTTLSAWVEIVFDNSDNRFPTGHPEVIIRRTIGSKKDEYSLDKKSVSKADVMNLLESAGFSRANPYYIVPQGRITSLTNAKESDRLNLLKEVAGTKVYEQRRSESLRLMEETETKRSKIGELLDYIEERLNELEEEKEELKEFQNKDKDRRCLEYAIHSRELEDIVITLDELEEERKNELHNSNARRDEFSKRAEAIANLETSITSSKQDQTMKQLEKRGLSSELQELVRSKTELQCVVDDLEKASELSGTKKEELEKDVTKLEKKIRSTEKELSKRTAKWNESKEKELAEKKSRDAAKARLDFLYGKQQKVSKYRTKKERDDALKLEIATFAQYEKSQRLFIETQNKLKQDLEKRLQDIEKEGERLLTSAEDGRDKIRETTAKIASILEEKAGLSEQMKEHWREEAKLNSSVQHATEQRRTADRELGSMMDKDTGSGLRAIDKIMERNNIPGVYGPLYRLLKVPDKRYNTAVELTAGNSLFHVVVDTELTAQKVLDIMLKDKTGRVTFMPLNRLKPRGPNFPDTTDAIPLLSKIQFDPLYKKAFEQVFGKTAVCKDLTIAAAYVRSHGLNTITLDGDKVERKGAMTGGYHDSRRSRLEAVRNVSKWSEALQKDQERLTAVRKEMSSIEQKITQLTGQIQVLEGQKSQAQNARATLTERAMAADRMKDNALERMKKISKDLADAESEMDSCAVKRVACEENLKMPMEDRLSNAEEQLLEALSQEVEDRAKALRELMRLSGDLESEKSELEIELEGFKRSKEELLTKLETIGNSISDDSPNTTEDLEAKRRELKNVSSTIEERMKQQNALDKAIEQLVSKLNELKADLEKKQAEQTEDARGMNRQQKNTERYLAKKQMLTSRKDECNRSIRDLGVLPEEAFEKYTKDKVEKLVKKLQAVNEALKKFSHVNKKALEQYNNFTRQRDQLIERREDLDKSATSIQELIDHLDQRKDEAIERTFKEVAKNFEEVFEKLVPAGRGRLIIQRKVDQDEEGDEEDEAQKNSVDNYTGISIKVSFNSKVDEGLRIQQLSGGQKSLVALATMFAIQKCDPAPFYLFDEIDANLDAQYRTAVANMIHELSSTAQFITTTFRPEMLTHANRFYGVLFDKQKVSSIQVITREAAQEFVDTEMQAQ